MTVLAAGRMLETALKPFAADWPDEKVEDFFAVNPGGYFVRRGAVTEYREAPDLDELAIEAVAVLAAHLRGQDVGEESPVLDCELPGGERLSAVLYPCTPAGRPSLAIRRALSVIPSLDDLSAQGVFELVRARALSGAGSVIENRKREAEALVAAGDVEGLLRACVRNRWTVVYAGETGSGKAQPLDAQVLTPAGWKTMGDMQVGSLVQCPDGRSAAVTGVFPQGIKEVFRVTFSDGRTVECCADHLWKVWEHKNICETGKTHASRASINGGAGWAVKPLSEIHGWFKAGLIKSLRAAVPLVDAFAIDHPPITLPIEPYALGALLGDGCFQKEGVKFASADAEIVDRLSEGLPDYNVVKHKGDNVDYYFRLKERTRNGSLRRGLNNLGLWNHGAHMKFIPDIYKAGSINQRLEVMRGLMDTDGSVGNGTHATFTSTSERLARDVQELGWSLGAIAKVSPRQTSYTYGGQKRLGRPSWRVSIVHPDVSRFFSLPRKINACSAKGMRHRLKIVGIESVGPKEVQCIRIDHPDHLYVTDGYVVTHNTTQMIALAQEIPLHERIVTVADTEELARLPHKNRVSFLHSKGGPVSAERLIEAALRNGPRWLLVPEVRGAEAFAFLRGLASGHPGMTSVHARSAADAFDALAVMIRQHPAGAQLPEAALRRMLSAFVDVVAHVERQPNGDFRVTEVALGWQAGS